MGEIIDILVIKNLSEILKRRRAELGYTYETLAVKLGISVAQLMQYEMLPEASLTQDMMDTVVNVLKVDETELKMS